MTYAGWGQVGELVVRVTRFCMVHGVNTVNRVGCLVDHSKDGSLEDK